MNDVDYDYVNDLLDSYFVKEVEVFGNCTCVTFKEKKIRKKKSKVYFKNKKRSKKMKKIKHYSLELVFTDLKDVELLLYYLEILNFKSLDYIVKSDFDVENID